MEIFESRDSGNSLPHCRWRIRVLDVYVDVNVFVVPSPSRDVHHGGAYMNTMPCGLMNSNAAPDKVGIFKDTRRERKAQYLPTFDPVCNRQDRKSSKYLTVATKLDLCILERMLGLVCWWSDAWICLESAHPFGRGAPVQCLIFSQIRTFRFQVHPF